jgi:hypothetical protein
MRRSHLVLVALLFVACATTAAFAQAGDILSPLQMAVACAPPTAGGDNATATALRIIGSQDAVPRSLFGDRDLLVIGGGTSAGVVLGQQFFVRRAIHFGASQRGRGAKTLGWVRVVAVNESTAIATVDHACGGMVKTDYLEPFVVPVLPADADRDETPGAPDFTTLGHVVVGNEDRTTVGPGDFVLIDWGENQGLTAGARFAIYRDVGIGGLPLTSIGEGVVIATANARALTRITSSRDAVYSGDYIALRK